MKVITPQAVISYPHIFEPTIPPNQTEPVFSCALVFGADTDISGLKQAALQVARDKWGEKAVEMIKSGKLRMPFRTDGEDKGYAPGSVFMNVKTKVQPQVVSAFAGANGKPVPIEDPKQLYAGCVVRASLRAFAYDTSGNRGISFALNNLQKIADGQRIDGRVRAEDEFEADPSAKPAAMADDLDDLI